MLAGVVFDRVTKRYGDVEVIRQLDLEVSDGEFMVLVGPSGCGKTTLLRLIAGLEDISGGVIRIGGRAVNDLPPQDRDLAMVFQSSALYPHMSVRENMDFGLRIKRLDRAEIDRRINDAVRVLGLDSCLDRKPRQLSGGQRQRVALGRAIVCQPSVFLFDEPLSNLDAGLRVQMRAEIARLHRSLRTTTVYVTHDQVEAMTMGHRIAVLDDGRIQQVGTPREVYEMPANLRVARFIGSATMNIIRGFLSPDAGRVTVRGFDLPLSRSQGRAAAGGAGREVLVGIRPEHLRSANAEKTRFLGKDPADGRRTVSVRLVVELVEVLGQDSLLHGRAGDSAMAARVETGPGHESGDEVDLLVDLDRLHLFDPASGRCLTSGV